jgi:hypothetical protein
MGKLMENSFSKRSCLFFNQHQDTIGRIVLTRYILGQRSAFDSPVTALEAALVHRFQISSRTKQDLHIVSNTSFQNIVIESLLLRRH